MLTSEGGIIHIPERKPRFQYIGSEKISFGPLSEESMRVMGQKFNMLMYSYRRIQLIIQQ